MVADGYHTIQGTIPDAQLYEDVRRLKDLVLVRAFVRFHDEHWLRDTIRAHDFRAFVAAEMEKWSRVVKEANIKLG